jgi:nitroimidazol reductase NimA-like FMN-containing flavoprotein (pyridoxamine 5'-phosphate oxidase superfamily)
VDTGFFEKNSKRGDPMFRPMRRHKQQLEHEACEHILERSPRGVLAVLGDNVYPYTVPLDFVYDND